MYSVLKRMAVTVVSDEDDQARIEAHWDQHNLDLPLDIVCSPYRELSRPLLPYHLRTGRQGSAPEAESAPRRDG